MLHSSLFEYLQGLAILFPSATSTFIVIADDHHRRWSSSTMIVLLSLASWGEMCPSYSSGFPGRDLHASRRDLVPLNIGRYGGRCTLSSISLTRGRENTAHPWSFYHSLSPLGIYPAFGSLVSKMVGTYLGPRGSAPSSGMMLSSLLLAGSVFHEFKPYPQLILDWCEIYLPLPVIYIELSIGHPYPTFSTTSSNRNHRARETVTLPRRQDGVSQDIQHVLPGNYCHHRWHAVSLCKW
jgi:hypothetical protein